MRVIKFARPSLHEKIVQAGIIKAAAAEWDQRVADAVSCPDNARLSAVKNAGEIRDGYQVMHNGLLVEVNGYYGEGITRMLAQNRGYHEPQEELVFNAVVARLPANAIMMECGSYWGFYSMCVCQHLTGARVILVEPSAENLEVGRRNFKANGFQGTFLHSYIGAAPGLFSDGIPVTSVDALMAEHQLTALDILHADIQGAEVDMIAGAQGLLGKHGARFVFISTHGDTLHQACESRMRNLGYQIICSITPAESYSFDGILVAARPGEDIAGLPSPSKKPSRGRWG